MQTANDIVSCRAFPPRPLHTHKHTHLPQVTLKQNQQKTRRQFGGVLSLFSKDQEQKAWFFIQTVSKEDKMKKKDTPYYYEKKMFQNVVIYNQ